MTSDCLTHVLQSSIDRHVQDLRYRQRQLHSMHGWLAKHADGATDAGIECGWAREEAEIVTTATLNEIRAHYDTLDLKQELKDEYSIKSGRNNPEAKVPYGIAYIVPQVDFLLFSTLSVVCAAIAAGNCCVVKLQDSSGPTANLLGRLLSEALDNNAFVTTSTAPPASFLENCVLVDQTGESQHVHVHRSVASSPQSRTVAVIDRGADLDLAAREVVYSRLAFNAASPYAVDCILVNEFVLDAFVTAVESQISIQGKTQSCKAKPSDFARTSSDENKKSVATSGRLELQKIHDRSNACLHHKSSSYAVPLLSYSSLDDAIDTFASQSDRLLALYVFAKPAQAKYLAQFIPSQASFVNHIPPELLVGPAVPSGFPVSRRTRYARTWFEQPSPRFAESDTLSATTSNFMSDASRIWRLSADARKPLKATGQGSPDTLNFFVQSLVASGIFHLAATVSIVGALVWSAGALRHK